MLKISCDMINPFILNRLMAGEKPPAVVINEKTVSAPSLELEFYIVDRSVHYAKGTLGVVKFIGRNIYFESYEEEKEWQENLRVRIEKEKEAASEKERKRVAEAKCFNENLNLPFNWRPAYKYRVRLLTDYSSTGTTKNTVTHIELLEKFSNGRLRREVGDYLCQKSPGIDRSGKDFLDDHYTAKVTCKACLKQALKLQKQK